MNLIDLYPQMENSLKALSKSHMKGSYDQIKLKEEAFLIGTEAEVTVMKRSASPSKKISSGKKFKHSDSFKSSIWSEKTPEREVDFRSEIRGSQWQLDHQSLRILELPESTTIEIITGRIPIDDIIEAPFIQGFKIHCIWHRGQQWIEGEATSLFDPVKEMNRFLDIRFENNDEYKSIPLKYFT